VNDDLGAGFWFKLIGVLLAGGLACILLFWLVGAAWVRWGGLGAILFFSIVVLTYAYFYDRRQAKKYGDLEG
jgi:hypothetical protein